MSSSSFVDVKRLNLDYRLPSSGFKRFLGRAPDAVAALRQVSFSLSAGDQIVLYGTDGAGKSSLLRVLSGVLQPNGGTVKINEVLPQQNPDAAAGYVSSEESENIEDTVYGVLHGFGLTHDIKDLSTQLPVIISMAGLPDVEYKPAKTLSKSQKIRLNVARAALSDAPIILLDDIADELGASVVKQWLTGLLAGRTVIVASRQSEVAEKLDLPLLLIHDGSVVHQGTKDDVALAVAAPRTLDAWVEGLRYDLFRDLKRHTGVKNVQLIPDGRFNGQRLRVKLQSGRYLPSIYDLISKAELVKVDEHPASFNDIVERL